MHKIIFILLCCISSVVSAEKAILDKNQRQIEFHENKLKQHPTSYSLYTILASYYLDNIRMSGDVNMLKKAKDLLDVSVSMQPDFAAYKTMADFFSYQHRFKTSLEWAEKAESISDDDSLISLVTENYIGLGELDHARSYLLKKSAHKGYYLYSGYAQWYAAQKKYAQAVNYFQKAANSILQATQNERKFQATLWATVSTAGMYLDSGQLKKAKVYLQKADRMKPLDKFLLIHWAEYYEALNEPDKALSIIEKLTALSEDASLYAIASRLAVKAGQPERASEYFTQAEKGFKKVINRGYIYTLGSLAQLYCDRGALLDSALDLANKNLLYKRDRLARNTLHCVESKLFR